MANQMLRLKPAADGMIVRDPDTGRILAPEGSDVPNTTYWRRRLRDGSAVIVSEPERAASAEARSSTRKSKN